MNSSNESSCCRTRPFSSKYALMTIQQASCQSSEEISSPSSSSMGSWMKQSLAWDIECYSIWMLPSSWSYIVIYITERQNIWKYEWNDCKFNDSFLFAADSCRQLDFHFRHLSGQWETQSGVAGFIYFHRFFFYEITKNPEKSWEKWKCTKLYFNSQWKSEEKSNLFLLPF
jgi:hypothetical protein